MSQQTEVWSKFFAAALANPYVCDQNESIDHVTELAAKVADFALAEYNKRSETLAKHEKEMTEMALELEARDAQVFAAITWLVRFQSLLDTLAHKDMTAEAVKQEVFEVARNGRGRLDLRAGEYVLVPNGWQADNPRLLPYRKKPN